MQISFSPLTNSEFARLDKAHAEDSGYNLYVLERTTLMPGVPAKIKHGIAVEPPQGYATEIRPRSSTLFRRVEISTEISNIEKVREDFGEAVETSRSGDWVELSVPCPVHVQYGTVDQNYRGELMTAAVNLGRLPVVLEPGERISQLVLVPFTQAQAVAARELSATARGAGGFGSTGR